MRKTPKERPENLPICTALILCEAILTRLPERHIQGVIGALCADELPTLCDQKMIFYQLGYGYGKCVLRAKLYKCGSKPRLVAQSQQRTVRLPDSYKTVNGGLKLPEFVLRAAGEYDLVLFADGFELLRHHLVVKLANNV